MAIDKEITNSSHTTRVDTVSISMTKLQGVRKSKAILRPMLTQPFLEISKNPLACWKFTWSGLITCIKVGVCYQSGFDKSGTSYDMLKNAVFHSNVRLLQQWHIKQPNAHNFNLPNSLWCQSDKYGLYWQSGWLIEHGEWIKQQVTLIDSRVISIKQALKNCILQLAPNCP